MPSDLHTPPNDKPPVLSRPVRYFALACDYDGTIARAGTVADSTLQALKQLKASGRKIILVTGRRLDDLRSVFPESGVFDRIVAENGGVLYRPESDEIKLLGAPPPQAFIEALRTASVSPVETGACVVATWEPNDIAVLKVIRDMGLELQVVYNKGAIMILPSGVDKGTGTLAALQELGLSPHNTVAIGDAENDHALLDACAVAVAVNNSIATLKEQADFATDAVNGAGVEQLIARLLADDLADVQNRRGRNRVLLGTTAQGSEVFLRTSGTNVLIAGPSSSGKSTIVHALLESILEKNFQVCLVDPEGDYDQVENVLSLGTPSRAPDVSEVLKALGNPSASVVVNLLGLPLEERPQFFGTLLLLLQEMRGRTGRPHWIIFGETHHLMPSSWCPSSEMPELQGLILVTAHPEAISRAAMKIVREIIAVGPEAEKTIREFSSEAGWPEPALIPHQESGNVLVWLRQG